MQFHPFREEEELKRVEGFTLWNEHAKIKFLCPVSILGENIDQEVMLEHLKVSVHPGSTIAPSVRLNQRCEITLFNFFN